MNTMLSFFLFVLMCVPVFGKLCTNITIPVNINTIQNTFNLAPIFTNLDAASWALNYTSTTGGVHPNGSPVTLADRTKTGTHTVDGNYTISAKFCYPETAYGRIPKGCIVQFLVHGIGFDKSYWDLPFNNFNYSYENVAVDEFGYCTLAIDRFGIAGSSKADPYNIVQAPATMNAIYRITMMLRAGSVPGVPAAFKKVVHVGHSFGSFLSYLMVTAYPQASDGLILTGYAADPRWVHQTLAGWNVKQAYLNQPLRFGSANMSSGYPQDQISHPESIRRRLGACLSTVGISLSLEQLWQQVATTQIGNMVTGWNNTARAVPQELPSGYLTWSDIGANINAFFYPGHFDMSIALFSEATKQPFTPGEMMTIGVAPQNASEFRGPVLVHTGRQDNIYCGGDCFPTGATDSTVLTSLEGAFPQSAKFSVRLQPNTGHGMNFHFNATAGYRVIQQFLRDNGLGA